MYKKILTITVLSIFALALTFNSSAQSKETIKEKIKELKGSIEKIVMQTDEGKVVFEGEDAEDIFNKVKNLYTGKGFSYTIKSDEDNDGRLIIVEEILDSLGHITVTKKSGKESSLSSKIIIEELKDSREEIMIEEENGEKKVTVTTWKDGEKSVKTYIGEEAKEYLESRDEDDVKWLNFEKDDDSGKKKIKILIEKLSD